MQRKNIVAEFDSLQLTSFIKLLPKRKNRDIPEVLVIEDQVFSAKLMLNVLSRSCKCQVAKDGKEAISKYAFSVPDIVFIDVELPDINGHSLAKLFRDTDPDVFLVMVTANNYAKDVEIAKSNKVQGFIIKPYNKQKILGSVENYLKLKNRM